MVFLLTCCHCDTLPVPGLFVIHTHTFVGTQINKTKTTVSNRNRAAVPTFQLMNSVFMCKDRDSGVRRLSVQLAPLK